MNNSTTENDGPLNSPGFMAYCILLFLLTLVASLMIIITIWALLKASSISRPVRLYLINLLFAGLLVAVVSMLVLGSTIVLIKVSSNHPRPLYLCRVYLWGFAVGAVTRLWSLAVFSISILAIVRFSKKTISKRIAAGVILILWLVPMILSLYILLPYVFETQFVHNVACFPDNNPVNLILPGRYTFLIIWLIFGGLTPLTVSIIVPIVCLCYIRKNIVTDGTQYRKGMAKFSLFLVVGGSINFAGNVIPGLMALNSDATPAVYISYSTAIISLIPTPIIIMAFIKPVQEEVKKILSCGKLCKRQEELKNVTSTTSDGIRSMPKRMI